MNTEIVQLLEKRHRLQEQIAEIDGQILEHKNKRKDALLAELKDLGLDELPRKLKPGRPKGYTMTEQHKEALRAGRARRKAAGR